MNREGITPQQQKGPTCGLVALSMCLEYFGVKVNVEKILETAKEKGFTKQGEMYSADFLADLTNQFLPNSAVVRGFPDAKTLSQSICDGKLILIAYDCGPNYQPVQVKGHSAHWLLACGFVEKRSGHGFRTTRESTENPEDVAIVGYQGKSTTLDVFPFSEVLVSNAQLLEAGLKRDPAEYIIPNASDLSHIRNRVVEVYIKT
ncbi:unnamed protein product [Caenorhabditis sp. 36 PRJEB53466]|nr:unnamed protein product [Caenorhabditis sp. 36 PRJEB53466]